MPDAAADLRLLAESLEGTRPLNWVFTGDSITHGVVHTQGGRSYVEHLHELIRGELRRVQDVVINTAVSGWRVTQLLEDFERRVASWRPDVVTLMIGTNDCSTDGPLARVEPPAFAASVTAFVERVRGLGAIPVLMTPPAVDLSNAPERARIAEFAQAIRDVATQRGTILADPFARFAELGTQRPGGIAWGLLNDPFHPNAAGHALLALELADTLGIRPEQSRTLANLHGVVAAA